MCSPRGAGARAGGRVSVTRPAASTLSLCTLITLCPRSRRSRRVAVGRVSGRGVGGGEGARTIAHAVYTHRHAACVTCQRVFSQGWQSRHERVVRCPAHRGTEPHPQEGTVYLDGDGDADGRHGKPQCPKDEAIERDNLLCAVWPVRCVCVHSRAFQPRCPNAREPDCCAAARQCRMSFMSRRRSSGSPAALRGRS